MLNTETALNCCKTRFLPKDWHFVHSAHVLVMVLNHLTYQCLLVTFIFSQEISM